MAQSRHKGGSGTEFERILAIRPTDEAEAMSVALQSSDSPAEAASRLLIRLGLAALFIVMPCTGVFWRGAMYVLLPVGGALILIGAMLDGPRHGGRRLRSVLISPAGGAALFLTFWACLSLLWTPFPEEAAGRFLKSSITTFLAVLVAVYLPRKTKPFDLYLLPAGLAMASAATLVLALFGSVLVFGWIRVRRDIVRTFDDHLDHPRLAGAWCLILSRTLDQRGDPCRSRGRRGPCWICSDCASGNGRCRLHFRRGHVRPSSDGTDSRVALWAADFLAPLLPLLYRGILHLTGIEAGSGSAPMLIWSDLIVSQWPRLITGHGFDFVHQGLTYGYLPERAPRSLLFVVWYDLGLAGAAGLTVLVMLVFRSAGGIAAKAAPALLAGLVAILTIAFLGIATAQIWWVTLLNCDAIAFALLLKGIEKAHRLDAQAIRAIEADTPGPSQDRGTISKAAASTP